MCNVYFNFSLLFQSSCPCQTAGIDIKACFWEFLAGISLSASTGECFEFASLQLPRFLAFLPLISFCYREDQGYPSQKLSTRTMGILVCLGNNFFCGNSTECTGVKRILRKPLTLKPNLHNKTGNRETWGYHANSGTFQIGTLC